PYEVAARRALTAKGAVAKGQALFKAQSCTACHTTADGQTLKGPHLVDIGKRYSAAELIESILRPDAKIPQGLETSQFEMDHAKVEVGLGGRESARSVLIREVTGEQRELKRAELEARVVQKQSMMPEGLVNNLTPEELASLISYLQSLTSGGERPR